MNLIISDTVCREDGSLQLPISVLKQTSAHLFIASNSWDTLYLDLSDDIPTLCLKFIRDKVKEVRVKLPDKVTTHTLKLLIELFPSNEGKLRKQFMMGGNLDGVLCDLWEHGNKA